MSPYPDDPLLDIDITYELEAVADTQTAVIPLVSASARFCGRVLGGKYRVERLVAEGGMGRVYAATHLDLKRPVAVKIIRSGLVRHASLVERFVNEARAAAMLRGENIAHVLDAGSTSDGLPYFVMEFLAGETVAEIVDRSGPFPVTAALDYALQICAGLSEAHALGIVHRDIKPQNVVINGRCDGQSIVKILDFGIAKFAFAADKSETQAEEAMGSPSYMSPEQIRTPDEVDYRTDIWSVGAVLYEMLTGRPAFDGETVLDVCAAVLADAPPSVCALRPEVPRELEAIVMRCLQKDRRDRFASVRELTDALESLVTGPTSVSPSSRRSWVRRKRSEAEMQWAMGSVPPRPVPTPARVALGSVAVVSLAAVAAFVTMAPSVRASVGEWISGPALVSQPMNGAERVYELPDMTWLAVHGMAAARKALRAPSRCEGARMERDAGCGRP